MYQALYRKYRPRSFDDVVGQEKITETLKTQVETGRLSHAYLFVGTRGTGKTTCAKILARAVNCEHPVNGNPCNQCKSCLGIEDGSIMDVVELDAASNNGVDNVRALRDEAVYSPAVVKKRVYIIDEVHMLSTSAFNALLKILEEPPEHLMFILATTELNKVPATILSRCQRYRFRRIDSEVIADRLRYVAGQEQMQLEPDAADLLAALADGALRDGLSLLDQCSGEQPISVDSVERTIGLADKRSTAELLWQITLGETAKALSIFESFWREGKSPAALMTELCALLRDILMLQVAPKGGRELLSAGYDRKILERFAESLSSEQILANVDSISERLGALRDGRDPKIACEMCIVSLCDPKLSDDLPSLRTRVARIESSFAFITVPDQAPPSARPAQAFSPAPAAEKPEPTAEKPPFEEAPPFDMPAEPSRASEPERPPLPEEPPEEPGYIPPEPPRATEPQEPSSAPQSAPAASGDFWQPVYDKLRQTMKPFHLVHLSGADAALDGDTVVVRASSAFHKNELEKTELLDTIKAAVEAVLGGAHPVKIVEKTGGGAENDKLDQLLKFGNVKCE